MNDYERRLFSSSEEYNIAAGSRGSMSPLDSTWASREEALRQIDCPRCRAAIQKQAGVEGVIRCPECYGELDEIGARGGWYFFMCGGDCGKWWKGRGQGDGLVGPLEEFQPPPKKASVLFMQDPHDQLYPPLFDGSLMRLDSKEVIKGHLLNALAEKFRAPDYWVKFTAIGSGVSYNWDEDGDLDIQVWVDPVRFREQNDASLPEEDIMREVRQVLYEVNFPSFSDLGLDGEMTIQYYAHQGQGTAVEQRESQPYAAYDMEVDSWVVEPKPFTPEFYAENFMGVQDKASRIAEEADALITQYDRAVKGAEYWQAVTDRDGEEIRRELEKNKQAALAARDAIKALYRKLKADRAAAYGPEGKGIEDPRDAVHKMLQVWDVWGRLEGRTHLKFPWEMQIAVRGDGGV